MSRNRSFYKREDSFTSGDLEVGFRYASDGEHTEDDEDSEFLQDIPYTSSSLDRSSIGSIPWADDAIKKNQLDWERVERMLHGKEELTQEQELRNEILEWQRKFPNLIGAENEIKKNNSDSSMHNNLVDSLDLDSISNLSLNSINEDDDHELYDNCLATPTNMGQKVSGNGIQPKILSKSIENNQPDEQAVSEKRGQLHNRGLSICSVPMKLRQRLATTRNIYGQGPAQVKPSIKPAPLTPPTPAPPPRRLHDQHSPIEVPLSASIAKQSEKRQSQMRMPPILNVLETKRRFRGLTGNNRSFVQLTHVQQAKSAAVTATHQRAKDQQTALWQLPLAAATIGNRFLNNRNTIILPSINLERAQESNSTGEVADLRYISSVPLGSYGMGSSGRRHLNLSPQRRAFNRGSSSTTPATTSSTGRSISAAVHPHSRYEFNAFYLPYSASKFKVLK